MGISRFEFIKLLNCRQQYTQLSYASGVTLMQAILRQIYIIA